MLSEQEHGVKVHRQQVWPDAEYQTAAELLLPGPGDLPLQLNGKKCCLIWELSQM